jgi:hypothetical protein
MPKLDAALLEQARRVDLIQYLEHLGHRPASGRNHKAVFHSPLRTDANPSFSVSYVDGAWKWYDFGTGDHGDGIDLVQHLHGVPFQDAVRLLLAKNPHADPPSFRPSGISARLTRHIYQTALAAMTPERHYMIAEYFLSRQLTYPAAIGAVYLERMIDEQGTMLPFLGIPLPSANVTLLRGIECRAFQDRQLPKELRRRTVGEKSVWVVRRSSPGVLVTESVIDCLAGDLMLDHRLSLVSINSIRNVDLLVPCMRQLRPRTIYLALDNDPNPERGPAAQERAKHQLLEDGFHVVEIRHHVQAGVKDLQRLLEQDRTLLTLRSLEIHAISHRLIPRPSAD